MKKNKATREIMTRVVGFEQKKTTRNLEGLIFLILLLLVLLAVLIVDLWVKMSNLGIVDLFSMIAFDIDILFEFGEIFLGIMFYEFPWISFLVVLLLISLFTVSLVYFKLKLKLARKKWDQIRKFVAKETLR